MTATELHIGQSKISHTGSICNVSEPTPSIRELEHGVCVGWKPLLPFVQQSHIKYDRWSALVVNSVVHQIPARFLLLLTHHHHHHHQLISIIIFSFLTVLHVFFLRHLHFLTFYKFLAVILMQLLHEETTVQLWLTYIRALPTLPYMVTHKPMLHATGSTTTAISDRRPRLVESGWMPGNTVTHVNSQHVYLSVVVKPSTNKCFNRTK